MREKTIKFMCKPKVALSRRLGLYAKDWAIFRRELELLAEKYRSFDNINCSGVCSCQMLERQVYLFPTHSLASRGLYNLITKLKNTQCVTVTDCAKLPRHHLKNSNDNIIWIWLSAYEGPQSPNFF